MVNLCCDRCGKVFQRKSSLDYHLANNVCNPDKRDDRSKHICKVCSKQFTTSTSMYRHMRGTCKIKKKNEQMKREIFEELLKNELDKVLNEKVQELQNEVSSLKGEIVKLKNCQPKIQNISNKINNSNINNGTVNNIILVGYGKEDVSKLSKKEILEVLQNGYHSAIKLTEVVHFNPKYPEYQNIYISNMKDKYAMMFDGKKWTLTMKEDLINQIYEDKKNFIEESLEEFVDTLTASRRQALKRWLDTDDADPKIKEIKENIKLLLYNSRKLIREADESDLTYFSMNSEDPIIESNDEQTERRNTRKPGEKKVVKKVVKTPSSTEPTVKHSTVNKKTN